MPRKRKKSKNSPEIHQNPQKRSTTMDQNGANTIQSENIGQLSQLQSGQSFMLPNPMYYNNNNGQYMQMNSASPVFSPNNTPSTPVNNTQMDMFTMIIQRLDSMDKRLSQLDSIQSSVKNITVRIDTIDQKVTNLEAKIKDIESSHQYDSGTLDELYKNQKEIDSSLQKLRKIESEQKLREETLQREITDLKCRSMRDNLLFFNIPEEKDENCEAKVLDIIESKLKIADAKTNIKLQRTHRVGAFKPSRIRPIVAKFSDFPDREKVRSSASMLKGSKYGIGEQFPPEVVEKRRKLIPVMMKARSEGKEAYLRIDKLYIDKQLYKESA